jgi:hypothetical protein
MSQHAVCILCKIVIVSAPITTTNNKTKSTPVDYLVSTNNKQVYPVHTECLNKSKSVFINSVATASSSKPKLSPIQNKQSTGATAEGFKIQHGNDLRCPPLWVIIQQQ